MKIASRWSRAKNRSQTVILLVLAEAMFATSQPAPAATIYVTNTDRRIDGGPGCSLPEAIYSAKWHTNKAYSPITGIVTTERVPGAGNDIIVLPTGGCLT